MSQPWLILAVITCSILMQACKSVTSLSDRILGLPGQPSIGFNHYSGYITVGDHPPRALFYYFVEAETSAASKPLVLWLNGGPGCSSFGYGAFIEHGPFKVKGGGLVKNEYSWNKVANLLYLESPAGVGFSYSTNQSFYKDINDIIAAQDSLVFLQRWFAKYPQYKGRDFFITGESYAGHYVPQLARLIVKSKVDFNLKAIAVAKELADTDAIDQYDILADLCLTSGQSKLNIFYKMLTSGHSLPSSLTSEDLINYQSFLDTKDPCEEQDVIKYFNRKEVQIALHAKLVGVRHWNTCNYDINENYRFEDRYISMIPILGELVKSGLRVLVYSGDLDAVIPFLGTRTMVDTLATKVLKLKTTLSYRAWFTSKQVAGYTQEYSKLSFATIRGASHTAPATQPERSMQLFTSFLKGKSLPTKA
ncbi:serine carboxypeptidase-like 45 isoform X3 [Syzygium oleosum]|uniref:serine carboxypeptidase-like 45 isoform X3 n=1 Tax=Syzygium oleosum TaxID=219896 RepID=UPI0024BB32D5|nr:serine carboxypeptidase-like 45 isoform X3 [Syzygium oleosum]